MPLGSIAEASPLEASPLHADIIDFLMTLLKVHHMAECKLSQIVRGGSIGIEIPRVDGGNNVRDLLMYWCAIAPNNGNQCAIWPKQFFVKVTRPRWRLRLPAQVTPPATQSISG